MILKNLKEFVKKNDIMYTVVVDLEKFEKFSFGKKKKIENDSLYNSLFGDEYCISRLDSILREQNIPQSWEQGNINCLVMKPEDNVIVGLFYSDKYDSVESYRFAKEINTAVSGLWQLKHM